jgi:hypothetical protein
MWAFLAWVGLAAAQSNAGAGSANSSNSDLVPAKSAATIGQTSIVKGAAHGATRQRGTRSPSNDDCANAYLVELSPCGSMMVTYQDDNTGATEDCPALSGGAYREVWFKLTISEPLTLAIRYCGTTPAFYNAYIVMDTTCPCSGAFVFASSWENTSCGDGNWTLNWMNLAPGTYYWPLLTDSAGGYAEGPYRVTFEAIGPPAPPACPSTTMYEQSPTDQSGPWNAYTSAVTTQFTYKCYENFSGLPEQIGDLHWWGLSLYFNPYYGWQLCDPTGMTFNVGFYTDNGSGQPGAQACAFDGVAPVIADLGCYSWAELYYFSLDTLQPCCALSSGWVSVQSQLNAPDCAFLWLNSPTGDYSAWQQPAGGSFTQLGTNLAFCVGNDDCGGVMPGACCDDYTGVCSNDIEWSDCLPPLRFTINILCADISPPCGIYGACCDADLNCVGTMLEVECDAIQGRFFPGETCPEWVCPADCEHRIDLYDCFGDGWNGNTLDVLVNGVTVLSQITLPGGTGPLTYYFEAATGDTIQTIYYPIGGWPYEPYYMIYGGLGVLLGQDGGNCQQPTGITVIGNCTPLTIGACCVQCECRLESEQTCLAMGGEWGGENVPCAPLACITDYCWPGAETCDEYISRVQIGAIDNSSGCEPDAQPPNYADYTNLCTDLVFGADTLLIVTNGNPIWAADYCAVWIDWNRDCSIEPSEEVGVLAGVGPYTFTVTPPAGAPLGWARMRIAISYYYTPDPCGLQLYGEVEDYAVHILEVSGACCWGDGPCTQELPSNCDGAWAGPFTQCSGNDCNGNSMDDFCDVAGGYSTDYNGNGIPDECELCGDLDSDDDVDLDDYWMFHDAFGTCVGDPKYLPAADLDGDGCVTLLDYQAWRMCFLMANGQEFVAPRPKPMPRPAQRAPQPGADR